jgi:hypothetical protein
VHVVSKQNPDMEPLWIANKDAGIPVDQHVAFRISFSTTVPQTPVRIRHAGVSWYNVFLDGVRLAEGPTRFVGNAPYFDETDVVVSDMGAHVLAVHAHSVGEQTRILLLTQPFVACTVESSDTSKPISSCTWRCCELSAYARQWRRMSCLLGWMENVALEDFNWTQTVFDDGAWAAPVAVPGFLPAVPLAGLASPATSVEGAIAQLANGVLWERYGYVDDDPAARLSVRLLGGMFDSNPTYGTPQGLWWRFDALRCRLLRPVLTISAPAGSVIEVCYCQVQCRRRGVRVCARARVCARYR